MSSRVSLWNLRRFPVHSGSKGTFHCGSMSDSKLSLSQWALTTQTQTQQLLLFWDKLQHKYFPNTQHKVPFLSKSHLQSTVTMLTFVTGLYLRCRWLRPHVKNPFELRAHVNNVFSKCGPNPLPYRCDFNSFTSVFLNQLTFSKTKLILV